MVRPTLLLPLLLLPFAPVSGQDLRSEPTPDELSEEAIEARVAALDDAPSLNEEERKAARLAYIGALRQWERKLKWDARGRSNVEEANSAPLLLGALRAQLAQPQVPPQLSAPPGADVGELEAGLAGARADLIAFQNRVAELQQEPARRRARLLTAQERIKTVEVELARLERALAEPLDDPSALQVAQRVALRVERRAVQAKLQAYRSQRTNDLARRELVPVQLEHTQRQQRAAEALVVAWEALVTKRIQEDAEAAAGAARDARLEVARRFPQLKALAASIEEIVSRRVGGTADAPHLRARTTLRAQQLRRLHTRSQEIAKEFNAVRLKVKLAGSSEAVGHMLRNEFESLPDLGVLRTLAAELNEELSQVRYSTIVDRERLERLDPSAELADLRASVPAGPEQDELLETAREMQDTRQRQLEALIGDQERYFELLVELERDLTAGLELVSEFRRYVEERILWVRSTSLRRLVPSPSEASAALTWLTDPGAWGRGLSGSASWLRGRGLGGLLAAILFGALLIGFPLRRWVGASVVERSVTEDSFGLTLRGLLAVVLRAGAAPLLIGALALALAGPLDQPEQVRAVGVGLGQAAALLFLFTLLRLLVLPGGLGEVHLRWEPEVCSGALWHLRWVTPLRVTGAFFVGAMHTQRYSDLWSDSLGRLAFVLSLAPVALAAHGLLRPGGALMRSCFERNPQGLVWRARRVLHLGMVSFILAFCLLSLDGYHYAAVRLQAYLGLWLWLCFLITIGQSVAARGLRVSERRALLHEHEAAEAQRASEAAALAESAALEATAASASQPAPKPESESAVEAESAQPEAESAQPEAESAQPEAESAQPEAEPVPEGLIPAADGRLPWLPPTREAGMLLRAAATLLLLTGTYTIWGGAVPALKLLDRFQLWPTIGWTEAEPALPPTTSTTAVQDDPDLDTEEAAATSPSSTVASAPSPQVKVVTLADLLLAVVLLTFTGIAAKAIPSVLELVLLPRLPLDKSSRYAIATLVRYAILLVGIPLGFAAVKIGWDDVQFLAAALTFGLAFGLQDIFANFISGLIILIERPIRIGDRVTVAGTSGVVTRIQTRATTIRSFERKELIVPNKQIVTGHVLNWALTDPTMRLKLSVRLPFLEDIGGVRERLLEVARAHPLVLATPEPSANFASIGEGFIELVLTVFFVQDKLRLNSELIAGCYAALAAEGIEPASTTWRVNVEGGGPASAASSLSGGTTNGPTPFPA